MDNKVLEDIKNYSIGRLKNAYTYCGVAEGDNIVMINSDDLDGNDIAITIKINVELDDG